MNNPKAAQSAFSLIIISFLLTLLGSCGSEQSSNCNCEEEVCLACDEKINSIEDKFARNYLDDATGMFKLIENFHRDTRETGSAKGLVDQVDMYFDMSSGLHQKVMDTRRGDKDLLTDLINIVSRENAHYFKLIAESQNKLVSLSNSEVGDVKVFVRNPDNYNKENNYAPLDTAVEAIVNNHDRQSIFITDGELARKNIPGVVDPSAAWAVGPFTQWLSEGNRLDFIVLTYANQERLFFIFFTPEKLANKRSSLIETFLEATKDLKRNDSYKHLKFTINDYLLEKNR